MICSSVKRFFKSNLLSRGLDSKAMCYSNRGITVMTGDDVGGGALGEARGKFTGLQVENSLIDF